MKELSQDQTQYLKERGFQVVEDTPVEMPYLLLGHEIRPREDDGDVLPYSPEMMFRHKLHTGGYEMRIHPNRDDLDTLLLGIENAVVAGRSQEIFAVPNGEKIPIIVKDSTWNPLVDSLKEKYS